MPAVSIIMPLYNCADFLRASLDSLAAQTCQDFELIMVDDGSTDDTVAIAETYVATHPNVSLLRQQHKYAGAARNLGMEHAEGEFFLFLDGDDYFSPRLVEDSLRTIREASADICVWRAIYLDNQTGQTTIAVHTCNKSFYPESKVFSRHDNGQNIFRFTTPSPWTKLFRAEFIRDYNLKFQTTRSANDLLFIASALALASKIVILDEELITYRKNNAKSLQATQSVNPLAFYDAICALQGQLKRFDVYDEVEPAFLNFAAETCAHNLYTLRNDPSSQQQVFGLLKAEGLEALGLTTPPDSTFYFTPRSYLARFLALRDARDYDAYQKKDKRIQTLQDMKRKLKSLKGGN